MKKRIKYLKKKIVNTRFIYYCWLLSKYYRIYTSLRHYSACDSNGDAVDFIDKKVKRIRKKINELQYQL